MPTINQILNGARTKKKAQSNKVPALSRCPQRKGICKRIFTMSPKKPNSATRKVVRVHLTNSMVVTAYVPGIAHNLQEHSIVLIRGGRTKDLPGLRYKCIRGKFDLKAVYGRKQGRSKYGAKKPHSDI